KGLADTNDSFQLALQGASKFAIHFGVGLAEILAALGVSNDHLLAANRDKHCCRYLSGECTLFLPVHVLCSNNDPSAANGLEGSGEADERRQDRNVIAVVPGDQRAEFVNEGGGLAGRFMHLPIGGDELFSHASQLNLSELPALRGLSKT